MQKQAEYLVKKVNNMNLDKIDVPLCFAFQYSEGPFEICVHYLDNCVRLSLNREEIKLLTNNTNILRISLCAPTERVSVLSEVYEKYGMIRDKYL